MSMPLNGDNNDELDRMDELDGLDKMDNIKKCPSLSILVHGVRFVRDRLCTFLQCLGNLDHVLIFRDSLAQGLCGYRDFPSMIGVAQPGDFIINIIYDYDMASKF